MTRRLTTKGWQGLPGDLWRLTSADLIVRLAYQMGKTPLLPIYAALLGASDLTIGLVVSISTATGLLLKPLFGLLSDRGGRKVWLIVGLAIFAGVPFLYRFVATPEGLYALRLLHGTATAIFGPVGLAYVSEMGRERRAERLGIFGTARSGGYLLAPVIAGLLLTHLPPEQVFTIIGFVSCLAFIPVAGLSGRPVSRAVPFLESVGNAIRAIRASQAFWLAAALETTVHVAVYALKAFLPVYALTVAGYDLLLVGLFFSLQELVHLLVRPFGGRLADRLGPDQPIVAGLIVLSVSFLMLGEAQGMVALLAVAVGLGAGLGLVLPSTVSLLSHQLPADSLGAGMGAFGALRNLGKIAGPILAGLVLAATGYHSLFILCAVFCLSLAVGFGAVLRRTRGPIKTGG